MWGQSLASLNGLKIWHCISHSSQVQLRSHVATAVDVAVAVTGSYSSSSQPLAWECTYAAGAALKSKKERKKIGAPGYTLTQGTGLGIGIFKNFQEFPLWLSGLGT